MRFPIPLVPGDTDEARRGWMAGIGSALLFDSTAPLLTLISGYYALGSGHGSLVASSLMFLGAAALLLPLALREASRSTETPLLLRDLPRLALITLVGGVLGPFCLMQAVVRLSPGVSALMLNLEAVFTVLLAVLWHGERLTPRVAVAGVLILAASFLLSLPNETTVSADGLMLMTLACLCWAIDNNLSQTLSRRNPLQVGSVKAVAATVPLVVLVGVGPVALPDPGVVLWLLLLGGVAYGGSILLELQSLRVLGAAQQAMAFSIAPFFSAGVAVLLLGARGGPSLLVAAGMMALGALLLQPRPIHG